MTELILASASASRARMLEAAGLRFAVHPACVDEDAVKAALLADGRPMRDIADALAELKAIRISTRYPNALVLGADQILVFENSLISKCVSMDDARHLLHRLKAKPHELISAAVLASNGAPVWRHAASARLRMRDFSDRFLEAYLAREGEALLDGVGCYRLEGRGAQLFAAIEGDHFTVLGLPLIALLDALRSQGVLPT